MHVQTHPQSTVRSYHVASHLADMEMDLETCGSTGLRVGLKCSTKAVYFLHQNPRVSAPVSWLNLRESSPVQSRHCIYPNFTWLNKYNKPLENGNLCFFHPCIKIKILSGSKHNVTIVIAVNFNFQFMVSSMFYNVARMFYAFYTLL